MTTKDEALKLALEALDGLSEPYDVLKAQEAIREALAQPEQEPVGVVGMDVSRPHMRSLDGQYFGQKPDTKTVMLFKDLEVGTKLYTAPPQRKPLTDEEIGRIAGETLDPWSCARAIEAKLRSKNQ